MERYQLIVLGIAIFATFLSYIIIFYTMTGNHIYTNTALAVQPCPDYWRLDPTTKFCVNTSFDGLSISSTETDCKKFQWARDHAISWEGINYGRYPPLDKSCA